MRAIRLAKAIGLAAAIAASVLPIAPASADEPSQWETVSDTGSLGNDVARFTGASPSLNMVNQGLDTVFVTGTSGKPQTAGGAVSDLDVGTTAYNADTGAVRWRSTFDSGLGINDQIAAFEVNFHNNLVYEVVNSGNDMVTIERSVSDGKLSRSATVTGARAGDSAISSVGGFLGVVGSKGSDFLALTYQTGSQTLEFQATPVAGRANSADISHTGSLDTTRTLLATGQSSGFGTGGDMYTTAYNYRTGAKLWERSFASPNNRADEGSVAEAAHVSALNKGVGFVAGRTFTPETGWDILVTAYDLATGAPLWAGPVRFNGVASDDDSPTHLAYSDKTSTLYLTGTSERGVPHGQDIVTIAFDAVTGEQRNVSYASGDSGNGDDSPTGLTVSQDGQRVFVAGDVQNLLGTGGRQAALFGYDSGLRLADKSVVGGPNDDRSAGVALNVAQSRVFLAGSTQTSTGFDHRAASFSLEGFELPKIPTTLAFTGDSSTTGQYTDSADLEALLTDDAGRPLADRVVTFSLAGEEITSTTNAAGLARATFPLTDDPDSYTASASVTETGRYLSAHTSSPFVIRKEDSAMTLAVGDPGKQRTLTARLFDADTPASGLSGRQIVFLADGVEIGRATTDSTGTASLGNLHARLRKGSHRFAARWAGDTWFLGSTAETQT